MNRITQANLEALLARINRATGQKEEPYTETEKGYKANVGTYVLDYAYGGVKLARLVGASGGQKDITDGFTSKKETYYKMHAFLNGVESRTL